MSKPTKAWSSILKAGTPEKPSARSSLAAAWSALTSLSINLIPADTNWCLAVWQCGQVGLVYTIKVFIVIPFQY